MERLDQRRNRNLAWFLGVFLFWSVSSVLMIGASIMLMQAGASTAITPLLLIPTVAVPLLIWIVLLARYALIQGRIRANPELALKLDDEMVRDAWKRAASTGFWTMLTVEVLVTLQVFVMSVLMGAGLVPPGPILLDYVQAPLAIAVGVGVTIGRYLYLRRG
jgi:hypothetical protein